MCKKTKLTVDDMEYMTVGMCLDYISEYFDVMDTSKPKVRKASQEDFDSFQAYYGCC